MAREILPNGLGRQLLDPRNLERLLDRGKVSVIWTSSKLIFCTDVKKGSESKIISGRMYEMD